MLPMELNLQTSSVTGQDALSVEEYIDLMMDRIDGILEDRLKALREMEKEKIKAAKAYNKRVKEKSFQVEELVWKTILLVGTRSGKFIKWSLSWEGPYKVTSIVPGNTYFVETLEGRELPKALNGKYLKKYYPSVWQEV
jgi:hypothetical protein